MTNAAELLRRLNPDEIRQRLDEIDGERKALMTLLRAAQRRRPRPRASSGTSERKGGTDAD